MLNVVLGIVILFLGIYIMKLKDVLCKIEGIGANVENVSAYKGLYDYLQELVEKATVL